VPVAATFAGLLFKWLGEKCLMEMMVVKEGYELLTFCHELKQIFKWIIIRVGCDVLSSFRLSRTENIFNEKVKTMWSTALKESSREALLQQRPCYLVGWGIVGDCPNNMRWGEFFDNTGNIVGKGIGHCDFSFSPVYIDSRNNETEEETIILRT
jgi:hypothetical protein